jgi:hypothetical protein
MPGALMSTWFAALYYQLNTFFIDPVQLNIMLGCSSNNIHDKPNFAC